MSTYYRYRFEIETEEDIEKRLCDVLEDLGYEPHDISFGENPTVVLGEEDLRLNRTCLERHKELVSLFPNCIVRTKWQDLSTSKWDEEY